MIWAIVLCFAVLIVLAVMIYTMPNDSAGKANKRKSKQQKAQAAADEAAKLQESKDWKVIAERWERQNGILSGEIEKLKIQNRDQEKQIESKKTHEKDLVEKLSLEKSWREKEQVKLDKAKEHEKSLKEEITRAEKDLEKEHSLRIRLDSQLLEMKTKLDSVDEERRTSNTKASSLQTTVDKLNKDLRELNAKNIELSKKKHDIQWVAKSDYDQLKKQLKAKEEELTQLKNPPVVS